MQSQNFKRNKQATFWFLFVFGAFLFWGLKDYITPLLGAVIFFVLFQKPTKYLVEVKKVNPTLASFSIILASLILVIFPGFFLLQFVFSQIAHVVQNPNEIIKVFEQIEFFVKKSWGIDLLSDKNINLIASKVGVIIPQILSETLVALGNLALMYLILYYLLKNYKKIGPWVHAFIPLSAQHLKTFETELQQMTISNVVASPLLALVQMGVAIIGYSILGLEHSFLWGFFTGIFSFIPFVGSALVWIPAALWAFAQGNQHQALYVLGFGALVVSNIDNVFRFILQKKLANVHPLITVFGVLLGIPFFGLPGFIFGPLMLSYFFIGLKLYRASYLKDKKVQLFENQ